MPGLQQEIPQGFCNCEAGLKSKADGDYFGASKVLDKLLAFCTRINGLRNKIKGAVAKMSDSEVLNFEKHVTKVMNKTKSLTVHQEALAILIQMVPKAK